MDDNSRPPADAGHLAGITNPPEEATTAYGARATEQISLEMLRKVRNLAIEGSVPFDEQTQTLDLDHLEEIVIEDVSIYETVLNEDPPTPPPTPIMDELSSQELAQRLRERLNVAERADELSPVPHAMTDSAVDSTPGIPRSNSTSGVMVATPERRWSMSTVLIGAVGIAVVVASGLVGVTYGYLVGACFLFAAFALYVRDQNAGRFGDDDDE